MGLDDLTDEEILTELIKIDKELFQRGVELRQRTSQIEHDLMDKFGHIYILTNPPNATIVRIHRLIQLIYRQQDLAMGGHIGVFMYNDIYVRISVPHVYGSVAINPFDFLELTPLQVHIMNTFSPEQINIFFDQFFDVADIQYGVNELQSQYASNELVARFSGLSRLNLHAAAAIVTGGYDYRGAVQSALLAIELALKANAAAAGKTEKELSHNSIGHRLNILTNISASSFRDFDAARVQRAISALPQYVANRYSPTIPARVEVGNTIMRAQYIVSEVIRTLSMRNFRQQSTGALPRCYPP